MRWLPRVVLLVAVVVAMAEPPPDIIGNITCQTPPPPPPPLPANRFPSTVVIINESPNPVRFRLCAPSDLSDVCLQGSGFPYTDCSTVLPPNSAGFLDTPTYLQYIQARFCSTGIEGHCLQSPTPLQITAAVLEVDTYIIPRSAATYCEVDEDCPGGDRQQCLESASGVGTCQYVPCGTGCYCRAITGSYSFGAGQWFLLDAITMVCMLSTICFILFTIRRNRMLAYEIGGGDTAAVVFPIYADVMLGLAIVYSYDALVWFLPPLLNLGDDRGLSAILPTLQIVKAVAGECVIEAVFLFLLQDGVGRQNLRAAIRGGILCGLFFGAATFLKFANKFGVVLPRINCQDQGKILSQDPSCWGTISTYVYMTAAWLVYTFALTSPYLRCVIAWSPQRPAVYRLLLCAAVLRTIDILAVLSPCFNVLSSLLWAVWFQLELYYCLKVDTQYWKRPVHLMTMLEDAVSPMPQRRKLRTASPGDSRASTLAAPKHRRALTDNRDQAHSSIAGEGMERPLLGNGHRRSYTSIVAGFKYSSESIQEKPLSSPIVFPHEDLILDFSTLKLRTFVARGATSSVHYGTCMGNPVAIKICMADTLSRKNIGDYLREAKILASFRHANIIHFVGACVVPPGVWLVSEYCAQGNLKEVSAGKEMPWRRRLDLMRGAARGLAHVHECEYIHGDVKPDNYLVAADGTVKLADFGEATSVSRVFAKRKKGRDGAGTVLWLAPERLAPLYSLFVDLNALDVPVAQFTGMSQPADVYALGITLWEVATGRDPFDGDSFEVGKAIVLRDIRPPCAGLEPTFTALLNSTWAREPAVRVTAAAVEVILDGQFANTST